MQTQLLSAKDELTKEELLKKKEDELAKQLVELQNVETELLDTIKMRIWKSCEMNSEQFASQTHQSMAEAFIEHLEIQHQPSRRHFTLPGTCILLPHGQTCKHMISCLQTYSILPPLSGLDWQNIKYRAQLFII